MGARLLSLSERIEATRNALLMLMSRNPQSAGIQKLEKRLASLESYQASHEADRLRLAA